MNVRPSRSAHTSTCQGMQRLAITCVTKSTSCHPRGASGAARTPPSPPLRELRGLEAPDPRAVEGRGPALWVGTSMGAQDGHALRWREGSESGFVLPSENEG